MGKSILFVINGFGMGNATRCDSIMDLLAEDYKIDVITSDRAYTYFQSNSKISELFLQENLNLKSGYRYGSLKYYLKYIPHFFKRLFKNYRTQKQIINSKKYDLIFFDSDYGFILHRIFGKNKNLFGVNNAFEIIKFLLKKPELIRLNLIPSLILEISDFLVYYLFCRYTLCPCLDYDFERHKPVSLGKVLNCPPLVRRSLILQQKTSKGTGKILVTASTSNIISEHSLFKNSKIDFTLDNTSIMNDSELVVCNSGQSTLSECLYLNKPAIVSAIPRHSEQYVNLLIVLKKGMLNLDITTDPEKIVEKKNTVDYNLNYENSVTQINKQLDFIRKNTYDYLC